jgi:hypothetical protein
MARRVSIQADGRATATWGVGEPPMTYWLDCLVEDDGSVLVWDEIADVYTHVHSLTSEQEARALAVAATGQRFEHVEVR